MGIPGLLPALKEFTKTDACIRDFQGQAIAVDTSSWLHKAVYSVADTYVEANEAGRVDPGAVRIASRYILQRCQEVIVLANASKLYLVLDGQHRCPLKAVTHQERTRRRAINLEQARKAPNKQAAYEKYKACIHISHAFTQAVLKVVRQDALFRRQRIVLVQSPNEADAQLIHLGVTGQVQAIITEDSDVLVYAASARCNVTVLYKFDRRSGKCEAICMDWLWKKNPIDNIDKAKTSTSKPTRKSKAAHQQVWRVLQARERMQPGSGRRLFVQACTLTGCDYCPNELPGVGLVTAFSLLTTDHAAHLSPNQRFEYLVRGKLSPRSKAVAYVERLRQAESVFYYHPVRHVSLRGHLAWMTQAQPEAPAFPKDNLSILGDPDMLRHVPLPDCVDSSVNHAVKSASFAPSSLTETREKASSVESVDEQWFFSGHSVASQTTKRPAPVKQKGSRKPIDNPYQRKRPLVHCQNPNQPKRPFAGYNPFARFQHDIGKENQRDASVPSSSCCPPTQQPTISRVSSGLSSKDKAEGQQDYETDVTDVSSVESPTKSILQAATEQGESLPHDKRDEMTFSSIAPPTREDSSCCPYFARSSHQSTQASSEPLTKDEGVEHRKVGNTTVRRVSHESAPGDSSQNAKEPSSRPETKKKVAAMVDFYDDWLSPKPKSGTSDEGVEIDEDSDESPAKPVVVKPVAPQGVLRFRLAGLATQKRTLVTRKSRQKSSLTSNKQKLLYGVKQRAGSLLDHFGHKPPSQH